MFTHDHERILERINHLKTLESNDIIVVEGKRDRQALRKLGIKSEIFLLYNKYKSLVEVSETLAKYDNVILMLDTDHEGQNLTKQMKNHLQAQGAKFDTKLGKSLLRACRTHTVESIARRVLI